MNADESDNLGADNEPLSPEEERLLELLSRYEERLATDSTCAEPADETGLTAELAEELRNDQAFIRELYQAFGQSKVGEDRLDDVPCRPDHEAGEPAEPVDPAAVSARAAQRGPEDYQSLFAESDDATGSARRNAAGPTRRVGRFQIVRELGRGGHGVVLLAYDPVLRRHVALKVPRPEVLMDPSMRRRFLREARTAARLTHPNLVAVFEVGEVGPICYLASSFCSGPTLAAWLKQRGTGADPEMAAQLVAQLADGIHYAHTQGVLHRDLKPSNVLLEPAPNLADDAPDFQRGVSSIAPENAESFVPMVTDFGLAKVIESGGSGSRTNTGAILGTPAYMAPEQADGRQDEVGRPTDVYALGAVLYEMLIGRPVFRGSTDLGILHKVLTEDPIAPRKLRRDVSADLEAIILKCLEKQPSRRYPTCHELAADLRRYLAGDPTHARPSGVVERALKWSRRRPTAAALIAVSVLAVSMIAGGSAFYSWQLLAALDSSEKSRVAEAAALEEAQQKGNEAIAQRNVSDQYYYAARIRQASQGLAVGAVSQAAEILAEFNDGRRLAGIRGFEWRYLKQALHGERLLLEGHKGQVYGVEYSPDGRTLASCGEDGTIRLWDPQSGRAMQLIQAHGSCANDLDFSPDGQLLASVGCDNKVSIWDTATWRETRSIVHDKPILCVSFSPDGQQLASADSVGHIRVWRLADDEEIEAEPLKGAITGICWSDDGQRLFVAGGMDAIGDYDSQSLKRTRKLAFDRPLALARSLDGKRIAVSGWLDNQVFDAATLEPLAVLPSHIRPVHRVAFSADGRQLFSCGSEGVVKIWTLPGEIDPTATSKLAASDVRTLIGHTERLQDLALAPDGRELATASFDGTVRIWNLTAKTNWSPELQLRQRFPQGSPGFQFAWSRDLSRMTALTDESQLTEWNLRDARLISSCPLEAVQDRTIILSGDSQRFIAWDFREQRISIGSKEQPQVLTEIRPHPGRISHFAFSDDLEFAATAADDWFIHVWNSRTGECVYNYPLQSAETPDATMSLTMGRFALNHNGRKLAIANLGQPFVIDVPTGKQLTLPPIEDRVEAIAFSPDDRYVAYRGASGIVHVVDLPTGRVHYTWRLTDRASEVAFSSDSKTLAIAVAGQITLYHIATGQEMTTLRTRSGEVVRMQFSANNRKLAAMTITGVDPATIEAGLYIWSTED